MKFMKVLSEEADLMLSHLALLRKERTGLACEGQEGSISLLAW